VPGCRGLCPCPARDHAIEACEGQPERRFLNEDLSLLGGEEYGGEFLADVEERRYERLEVGPHDDANDRITIVLLRGKIQVVPAFITLDLRARWIVDRGVRRIAPICSSSTTPAPVNAVTVPAARTSGADKTCAKTRFVSAVDGGAGGKCHSNSHLRREGLLSYCGISIALKDSQVVTSQFLKSC
jgi:hypothetical protein